MGNAYRDHVNDLNAKRRHLHKSKERESRPQRSQYLIFWPIFHKVFTKISILVVSSLSKDILQTFKRLSFNPSYCSRAPKWPTPITTMITQKCFTRTSQTICAMFIGFKLETLVRGVQRITECWLISRIRSFLFTLSIFSNF